MRNHTSIQNPHAFMFDSFAQGVATQDLQGSIDKIKEGDFDGALTLVLSAAMRMLYPYRDGDQSGTEEERIASQLVHAADMLRSGHQELAWSVGSEAMHDLVEVIRAEEWLQ